jgi:hypothetical protein
MVHLIYKHSLGRDEKHALMESPAEVDGAIKGLKAVALREINFPFGLGALSTGINRTQAEQGRNF